MNKNNNSKRVHSKTTLIVLFACAYQTELEMLNSVDCMYDICISKVECSPNSKYLQQLVEYVVFEVWLIIRYSILFQLWLEFILCKLGNIISFWQNLRKERQVSSRSSLPSCNQTPLQLSCVELLSRHPIRDCWVSMRSWPALVLQMDTGSESGMKSLEKGKETSWEDASFILAKEQLVKEFFFVGVGDVSSGSHEADAMFWRTPELATPWHQAHP